MKERRTALSLDRCLDFRPQNWDANRPGGILGLDSTDQPSPDSSTPGGDPQQKRRESKQTGHNLTQVPLYCIHYREPLHPIIVNTFNYVGVGSSFLWFKSGVDRVTDSKVLKKKETLKRRGCFWGRSGEGKGGHGSHSRTRRFLRRKSGAQRPTSQTPGCTPLSVDGWTKSGPPAQTTSRDTSRTGTRERHTPGFSREPGGPGQ